LPACLDPGSGAEASAGAAVRQAHAARQQTLAHNVANDRAQIGSFTHHRSETLLAGFRSLGRRCDGGNGQTRQKSRGKKEAFHAQIHIQDRAGCRVRRLMESKLSDNSFDSNA
jgi:hypothetical protein